MSIPPASRAFSAYAHEYTAVRRRVVPGYDDFYGSVIDLLRLLGDGAIARVLDLGAGTGLLSDHVSSGFPGARFELLDGSAEMLSEARELLGDRVVAEHLGDMAHGLPGGPFDAVVSALAIHHLADADKKKVYEMAHDALRPGGLFVNAEQVAGPTPELEAVYQRRWADDCRALGASEDEIALSRERRRHDRSTDVETQLRWLREAGFAHVDCVYKSWSMATLVGVRAGGSR